MCFVVQVVVVAVAVVVIVKVIVIVIVMLARTIVDVQVSVWSLLKSERLIETICMFTLVRCLRPKLQNYA